MATAPEKLPARVFETERDAALARVKDAFAAGQLSSEEMEERLHVVLTASTRSELTPALASLPEPPTGQTVEIETTGGRVKRRGAWTVPRVLTIASEYGGVDLDLSEAIIRDPVIDIELRLPYKNARIIVPHDATVDYEGLRATWKQPVYTPPSRSRSGGPLIRISGEMTYGRLRIKHARH